MKRIFFRIDGNHRLSAFEDNQTNELSDLIAPLSLIFFRTKEDYETRAKIIFHNINFKSFPLTMEQNLKLIFNDEYNFGDEILKQDSSFGMPYYNTKQMIKVDFSCFKNLEELLVDKRSDILKFFKFLESKQIETDIDKIKTCLSKIEQIYSDHNILKQSNNTILLLGFLYYFILLDAHKSKKIALFIKWVLKNHIYESKMNLESLINIFDEIYESRIRSIFIAMPFKEKTSDNVYNSIVNVYNELINEGYELDKSLCKDGKYLPYRVDKDMADSKDIIQKIINGIKNYHLMIADLTYSNANVYYEVGLAQAQNKPLILLYDENLKIKDNKVKFDLITIYRLNYNSDKLDDFERNLKERLKSELEKICEPIK